MLSQDEAELRRLVVRIHVRCEALRGVIPQDPEFQAVSWLTTLRYVATAMGSFVPPSLPVPAGQVFEDDLPGPHQVPASPAAGSVLASPSLVDSVDSLAADLERDLRDCWPWDCIPRTLDRCSICVFPTFGSRFLHFGISLPSFTSLFRVLLS